MYKPQKHLRLEPLNRFPNPPELVKALQQARSAKGCLVEIPWRSAKTGKNYSLAVRIELGQTEPVWTLFEGEGASSHATWSVPFQDMELLNDVLLLSLPQEFDNPAKTIQNVPAARALQEMSATEFPPPTITRVTPLTPAERAAQTSQGASASSSSPIISPVGEGAGRGPASDTSGATTASKGASPSTNSAMVGSGERGAAPDAAAGLSGVAGPARPARLHLSERLPHWLRGPSSTPSNHRWRHHLHSRQPHRMCHPLLLILHQYPMLHRRILSHCRPPIRRIRLHMVRATCRRPTILLPNPTLTRIPSIL